MTECQPFDHELSGRIDAARIALERAEAEGDEAAAYEARRLLDLLERQAGIAEPDL